MYMPNRRQVDVEIKLKVDVPLHLKNNISTYITEHLEEIIKEVSKEKDFGKVIHDNWQEDIHINGNWSLNAEDYEN